MAFQLATNLEMGAKVPLDTRSVVSNIGERDSITQVYPGLTVYVTGENKYYYYNTNNSWVEFGSSQNLNNLVYVTGDQTISGNKQFSGVVISPFLTTRLASVPKSPTFTLLTGAGGTITGTRHGIPFTTSSQDQEALSNFINSQSWVISGRNGSGPYNLLTPNLINTTGFIDIPVASGNNFIYAFTTFNVDDKLKKIEKSGIFALLSGEKVGIGTITPTEKLHVIGNLKLDGELQGSKDFNFEMPLQNLGPQVAGGLKLIGGNFTGSQYFGEHIFISGGNGNSIGGHIVLQGGRGAVLSGEVAGWGDYFRFNGIPIIDQFGRVIAPDVLTNRNDIIVNRNIFRILNTGRGNIFGGEIILSGGSATGAGTPNIGGPIRFIGGSGVAGISGFFEFKGESITFNENKFLVQKNGDISGRSLSCIERPIANGTGVLLSGEAVAPLVDINNITGNFIFNNSFNAKLLTINAAQNITGTVPTGFPTGYNVSFVQMGNGQLFITGSGGAIVRQRLNLFRTAGQYGIASLLHHSGNQFILYGDLI
jgi:hypothetical protein